MFSQIMCASDGMQVAETMFCEVTAAPVNCINHRIIRNRFIFRRNRRASDPVHISSVLTTHAFAFLVYVSLHRSLASPAASRRPKS